jgi:hypothetical protein
MKNSNAFIFLLVAMISSASVIADDSRKSIDGYQDLKWGATADEVKDFADKKGLVFSFSHSNMQIYTGEFLGVDAQYRFIIDSELGFYVLQITAVTGSSGSLVEEWASLISTKYGNPEDLPLHYTPLVKIDLLEKPPTEYHPGKVWRSPYLPDYNSNNIRKHSDIMLSLESDLYTRLQYTNRVLQKEVERKQVQRLIDKDL